MSDKVHLPGPLGLLMLRLSGCRLFYPMYHAAQLYRTENTFFFDQLPDALDGFRIVYASDIHFGAYLGRPRVEDLVSRMNSENAGLVLLGGDYGEDTAASIRLFQEISPAFTAKLGAYAIHGNHDQTDPGRLDELQSAMRNSGIQPLLNSSVTLSVQGTPLTIAGVDDIYTGTPAEDLLEKECEGKGFTILLSHSPDVLPPYFDTHEKAHFDLFLCGHTHGGQLAVMGRAIHSSSRYKNRYNRGEKQEKGSRILISMGVGTSLFPVRWGTRGEYHVITLKKK